MALGWFSLLKTVPWTEVISTAPLVAQGAKKLWDSVAKKTPPAPTPPPAPVLPTHDVVVAELQARILALEAASAELHTQMRASSELIQALATQNAELVQRAEANRVRLRWVSGALVALAVGLVYALRTQF
jgi:hypothetical protein|nr:hypothetical protein [uncultured Albidiferax sp.]